MTELIPTQTYREINPDRLKTILDPREDIKHRWSLIKMMLNRENRYHSGMVYMIEILSKSFEPDNEYPASQPLEGENISNYTCGLSRQMNHQRLEALLDDKGCLSWRAHIASLLIDVNRQYDNYLVIIANIIIDIFKREVIGDNIDLIEKQ